MIDKPLDKALDVESIHVMLREALDDGPHGLGTVQDEVLLYRQQLLRSVLIWPLGDALGGVPESQASPKVSVMCPTGSRRALPLWRLMRGG